MVAVDICNLALSYLGDSATVASLDPPEGSAQAQHCARFYPIALGAMLNMHDWSFVTTRMALALLAGQQVDGWCFVYALPSDAVKIISVLPMECYPLDCSLSGTTTYPCETYPEGFYPDPYYSDGYYPGMGVWRRNRLRDFQIEIVNGKQAILTNACDAIARYTTMTVQTGTFPPLFTDALAWKLASMLAGPILKNDAGSNMAQRCLSMHSAIAAQAMGQDSNQRHSGNQPVPAGIAVRA